MHVEALHQVSPERCFRPGEAWRYLAKYHREHKEPRHLVGPREKPAARRCQVNLEPRSPACDMLLQSLPEEDHCHAPTPVAPQYVLSCANAQPHVQVDEAGALVLPQRGR